MVRDDLIRECRGGALMLAVGYLAVMTLAAAAFLSMLHYRLASVREAERTQVSEQIAEAGMEVALAKLAEEGAAYEGARNVAFGMGRFSIACEPRSSEGAIRVTVVGELLDGDRLRASATLVADVTLNREGGLSRVVWSPREVRE